jgi:hypothetical protein
METEDWSGLVVRTRAALPFGVAVGVFTDGPHAGRLRVHGAHTFGGGTQAEWQGTLVYAIPPEVVRSHGGEAYDCRWRRWRPALPDPDHKETPSEPMPDGMGSLLRAGLLPQPEARDKRTPIVIPTALPCPAWTLDTQSRALAYASKVRSASAWITVAAATGIVCARPLPFPIIRPNGREPRPACSLRGSRRCRAPVGLPAPSRPTGIAPQTSPPHESVGR